MRSDGIFQLERGEMVRKPHNHVLDMNHIFQRISIKENHIIIFLNNINVKFF